MSEDTTLRQDQYDLLYNAERMDEPVLVEASAVDEIREALSIPLSEMGLRDRAIESMELEALAAAVTPDEDEHEDVDGGNPLALSQQPETGGTPAEDDDPEGVEALSASERAEVRDKLERAEKFDSRIPKHCESLRQEAVDMVPGAEDVDDIDIDRL